MRKQRNIWKMKQRRRRAGAQIGEHHHAIHGEIADQCDRLLPGFKRDWVVYYRQHRLAVRRNRTRRERTGQ